MHRSTVLSSSRQQTLNLRRSNRFLNAEDGELDRRRLRNGCIIVQDNVISLQFSHIEFKTILLSIIDTTIISFNCLH